MSSKSAKSFSCFGSYLAIELSNPLKNWANSSDVKSANSFMPTVKVCCPFAASLLCFSMKSKLFSQTDLLCYNYDIRC